MTATLKTTVIQEPSSATANITLGTTGNVGIGTASPSFKLSVDGDISIPLQDKFYLYYVSPTNNASVGTNLSGDVQFTTGITAPTERLRIDNSGNVLITSPAGLGYGTGSGGTVTQTTNKSTLVTLNKPTGQITMSNAALAAGNTVGFALSNSLLTATDSVIVSVQSGTSTAANYQVWTGSGGAGFIGIYVRNNTGGSLSEAIVLNFAIIKGATS